MQPSLFDHSPRGPTSDSGRQTARAGEGEQIGRGLRVLLAEDNPINQTVAEARLNGLGCEVVTVVNGMAAIQAVSSQGFNIVFMDCMMPEMDGYEATRIIRDFERKQVPGFGGRLPLYIVALTANAMPGDREKCIESGMNEYITKPLRLSNLLRVFDCWRAFLRAGSSDTSSIANHATQQPGTANRADEKPLIDFEILGGIFPDQRSETAMLIETYIEQTEGLLRRIDTAIVGGGAEMVRHIVHKCAGSSATCGVTAMVDPLRALERCAAHADLSDAVSRMSEIRGSWTRARAALESYRVAISRG